MGKWADGQVALVIVQQVKGNGLRCKDNTS